VDASVVDADIQRSETLFNELGCGSDGFVLVKIDTIGVKEPSVPDPCSCLTAPSAYSWERAATRRLYWPVLASCCAVANPRPWFAPVIRTKGLVTAAIVGIFVFEGMKNVVMYLSMGRQWSINT
jgi:hypothetical protein